MLSLGSDSKQRSARASGCSVAPAGGTARRSYPLRAAIGGDGAGTGTLSTTAAYLACRAITREVARTFYYGSLFLPPEKRRAAWALYAFCRIADDMADEPGLYPDPASELAAWRAALLETYAGRPRGPVMTAWADVLTRFAVPLRPALELLDGVEMDLRNTTYETFEDLRLYCYRVAGTVGLLMAPVLGYTRPEAIEHAVDLGIAMQLTNILRDIGEDRANGRVYLPAADLARFGYDRERLLRGEVDAAFQDLLQFEIARAEAYYVSGRRGIALLAPDARLAIALSATLYHGILRRIQRNRYDVFTRRAHVSLPGKLAALPATWLWVKLGEARIAPAD
ncbi:MAG TPA: phytoene/squalene synthase family protein [Ktedonobacterales bacterium]|nr:phytoene/squalene synthase family protein [Ktedonobacterales bacterium]